MKAIKEIALCACVLLTACNNESAHKKTPREVYQGMIQAQQDAVGRLVNILGPDDSAILNPEVNSGDLIGAQLAINLHAQSRMTTEDTTQDTINAEQQAELDQIVGDYQATMQSLAPATDEALTLDYVDKSFDGELIVDDMVIDPATLEGALTTEVLNAEARGEDTETVLAGLEDIADDFIANGDDDELRGLYTGCELIAAGLTGDCTLKWPGGKVYYYYGNIPENFKPGIEQAMQEWNEKTGGKITFVNIDSSMGGIIKTYIALGMAGALKISSKELGESVAGLANIGYSIGYRQNMYLDDDLIPNGDADNVKELMRTARHELGHVLGLRHEHQRWDRDEWVYPINSISGGDFKKIDKYGTISFHFLGFKRKCKKFFGHKVCISVPYWKEYDQVFRNAYAPTSYDCKSVMHYSGYFRTKKECSGLPSNKIILLSDTYQITESDVYTVLKLY